jgi:hypothetical protein
MTGSHDGRTGEQPEVTPTVSTAPARSRWSRVPAHLGRARTSTVVLVVLFLALGMLYLNIRPETPSAAGTAGTSDQQPASTTAPAAPTTSTPPPSEAPETSSEVPTTTEESTPTEPTDPTGTTTTPSEPADTTVPTETGTTGATSVPTSVPTRVSPPG